MGENVEKGGASFPQPRVPHSRDVLASKLKIIGNALILGQIELLAEVMTLADKAEVGAANVSALGIAQRRDIH